MLLPFRIAPLICFLISLFLGEMAYAQTNAHRFYYPAKDHSHRHVSAVCQDQQGFVWFATNNGLIRYDGANFKRYQKDETNPHTILHNYVLDIYCGPDGHVWVSDCGGVSMYDRDQDRFQPIELNPAVSISNAVTDFEMTPDSTVWMTASGGLYRMTLGTGQAYKVDIGIDQTWHSLTSTAQGDLWLTAKDQVVHYVPSTGEWGSFDYSGPSLNGADFRDIQIANDGSVWVTGWNTGLFTIDSVAGLVNMSPQLGIPLETARCIAIGVEDQIWVGLESHGLYLIDTKTKQVINHDYSEHNNPYALHTNGIWSLYFDNKDRLWVGTYDKGLCVIDPNKNRFNIQTQVPGILNSLSDNSVLNFAEDQQGAMWISIDGAGVNEWNREAHVFTHHMFHLHQQGKGKNVNALYGFLQGQDLWMGSWGDGLVHFNTATDSYKKYLQQPDDTNSIGSNMVFKTLGHATDPDLIWLTTWDRGIDLFNKRTGQFWHLPVQLDDNSSKRTTLAQSKYFDLVNDSAGNLWLAGTNGVERLTMDEQGNLAVELYRNQGQQKVLSDNTVNDLYMDYRGQIWAGTNEGLDVFNPDSNAFEPVITGGRHGSEIVCAVVDDGENIWFTSEHGLHRLKTCSGCATGFTTVDYDVHDGLQSGAFNMRSAFRSSTGELFFGGVGGLNYFDPYSIGPAANIEGLYFNSFKVFNVEVVPGDSTAVLSKSIEQTTQIELNHKQRVFSIGFSSIAQTNAEKIAYQYQLSGFDENWIDAGPRREATYTKLDPGTYTFRVKAINQDGKTYQRPLTINILPAWWETGVFKVAVVLAISLLIYLIIAMRLKFLRRQKVFLEQEVKAQTERIQLQVAQLDAANKQLGEKNTSLKQLASEREVLVAEMNHRIKNNLAVISGIMTLHYTAAEGEQQKQLFLDAKSRIQSMSSVHTLLYQGDSMTEISMSELIGQLLDEVSQIYQGLHQVDIQLDLDDIYIDLPRAVPVALIATEVLSNCFKHGFTNNDRPMVKVVLKQDGKHAQLIIADNGHHVSSVDELSRSGSLGTHLIDTLVQQIDATQEYRIENGVVFEMRFAIVEQAGMSSAQLQ